MTSHSTASMRDFSLPSRNRRDNCLCWVITETAVVISYQCSLRKNPEERNTASIYKSMIRKSYITNSTTVIKNTEHTALGLHVGGRGSNYDLSHEFNRLCYELTAYGTEMDSHNNNVSSHFVLIIFVSASEQRFS